MKNILNVINGNKITELYRPTVTTDAMFRITIHYIDVTSNDL